MKDEEKETKDLGKEERRKKGEVPKRQARKKASKEESKETEGERVTKEAC